MLAGRSLKNWKHLKGNVFKIIYPWQLLDLHAEILSFFTKTENPGAAQVDGVLIVGKGSRILPGVYVEGVVMIGKDCKIGPNCYLRGSTSVGHGCHVGQGVELKNSIVGDHTAIGHLSYVGDSILGNSVNLGAGTITANFRHDAKTHRSEIGGELVETGRKKLGAIIGDGVRTGIHTSIYPGRKIGPGLTTLPSEVVSEDLF